MGRQAARNAVGQWHTAVNSNLDIDGPTSSGALHYSLQVVRIPLPSQARHRCKWLSGPTPGERHRCSRKISKLEPPLILAVTVLSKIGSAVQLAMTRRLAELFLYGPTAQVNLSSSGLGIGLTATHQLQLSTDDAAKPPPPPLDDDVRPTHQRGAPPLCPQPGVLAVTATGDMSIAETGGSGTTAGEDRGRVRGQEPGGGSRMDRPASGDG